jgi:BLOC-1-related complex sub-unit 8
MMKYLANEPSVGLYFVQQHVQASMPNLLSVKVVLVINFQQFMINLILSGKKRNEMNKISITERKLIGNYF